MKRHVVRLLKMFARYALTTNEEQALVDLRIAALEGIVALPVLFKDRHGLTYLLYPDQSPGIYLRYGGNYEVDESEFCLSYVQEGMTVVDVGANIGLYTLLFGMRVGAHGAVHSFEAESLNFNRLRQNVRLNEMDQVRANHLGVFSSSGTIDLNVYPERFAAWHTIGSPQLPDPDDPSRIVRPIKVEQVQAVSLDDYCAENSIQRIDLLKVDVEGAEMDVLLGCEQLIAEDRIGCILFEASRPQIEGMGRQPDEVFKHLIERRFRIFSLSAGQLSEEVAGSDARYENFVAFSPSVQPARS